MTDGDVNEKISFLRKSIFSDCLAFTIPLLQTEAEYISLPMTQCYKFPRYDESEIFNFFPRHDSIFLSSAAYLAGKRLMWRLLSESSRSIMAVKQRVAYISRAIKLTYMFFTSSK